MLGCTETVTLVHHDRTSDDDNYICTTFKECASWFKKQTITTDGNGAKPVNTFECRILTDANITISPGDWLVHGEVSSVETPTSIDLEKFRITAIGDNRRGILAHWRVSGQ